MGAWHVCVCVHFTAKQQQSEAEIRELLSCRTHSFHNKNGKFRIRCRSTHVCVRKFVFMFVLIESQQLQQPAPNEYVEHQMGSETCIRTWCPLTMNETE